MSHHSDALNSPGERNGAQGEPKVPKDLLSVKPSFLVGHLMPSASPMRYT
jgi:hypothetical protein